VLQEWDCCTGAATLHCCSRASRTHSAAEVAAGARSERLLSMQKALAGAVEKSPVRRQTLGGVGAEERNKTKAQQTKSMIRSELPILHSNGGASCIRIQWGPVKLTTFRLPDRTCWPVPPAVVDSVDVLAEVVLGSCRTCACGEERGGGGDVMEDAGDR
jgi:hypothetical protein